MTNVQNERTEWKRSNHRPKPSVAGGRTGRSRRGRLQPNNLWKRTQGTTQAASGCRTRLSYPAPKQSSMQVGTPSHQRNPTRSTATGEVCRRPAGVEARGHAKKEPRETWDALKRPDAPTAGANREGTFQRQEERSESNQGIRSVHSSRTIRAKEPTPSRSPHRNQRRKNDANKAGQPPCGP